MGWPDRRKRQGFGAASTPGLGWAAGLSFAAAFAASVAHACSCLNPGSAAQQLAQADLMIVARVSDTRRLPSVDGYQMAQTRFVVSETIKGPVRRYWVVRHRRGDSALCGSTFRPGQDYAFAARFEGGKVWTGSCDRAWFALEAYRVAASEASGSVREQRQDRSSAAVG